MQDLQTPLTDDELEWLDEFLATRGTEEEEEAPDADPGLLNIFELDGFLTAVVSGPAPLNPSDWWPAVWGEDLPEWADEQAMLKVFGLVVRHMNSIADALMHDPESFEPMFGEREFEGERYTIVDEWCMGYMHGVELTMDAWLTGSDALMANLAPLMMFGTEKGWEQLNTLSDEEVDRLREAIPEAVRALHGFWLKRREHARQPVVREDEKVGRNDPCPCGSGKKYKKCCLH